MSDVKPALTREEWAVLETDPGGDPNADGQVFVDDERTGAICVTGGGTFYEIPRPHSCAALCLHGQPFGFTREDVADERFAAEMFAALAEVMEANPESWISLAGPGFRDRIARARDRADRIEALLPPEET